MVKVDLVTGWNIQSKKYELVVPVYIVITDYVTPSSRQF